MANDGSQRYNLRRRGNLVNYQETGTRTPKKNKQTGSQSSTPSRPGGATATGQGAQPAAPTSVQQQPQPLPGPPLPVSQLPPLQQVTQQPPGHPATQQGAQPAIQPASPQPPQPPPPPPPQQGAQPATRPTVQQQPLPAPQQGAQPTIQPTFQQQPPPPQPGAQPATRPTVQQQPPPPPQQGAQQPPGHPATQQGAQPAIQPAVQQQPPPPQQGAQQPPGHPAAQQGTQVATQSTVQQPPPPPPQPGAQPATQPTVQQPPPSGPLSRRRPPRLQLPTTHPTAQQALSSQQGTQPAGQVTIKRLPQQRGAQQPTGQAAAQLASQLPPMQQGTQQSTRQSTPQTTRQATQHPAAQILNNSQGVFNNMAQIRARPTRAVGGAVNQPAGNLPGNDQNRSQNQGQIQSEYMNPNPRRSQGHIQRQNQGRNPGRTPGAAAGGWLDACLDTRTVLLCMLAMLLFFISLYQLDPRQKAPAPGQDPPSGILARPGEKKVPVLVVGPDTKREPLPVFHDLTALYRSWATFSTWRPFDTSVTAQHDDRIDLQPLFSKILDLGDLYDLETGVFSKTANASERRATPLSELKILNRDTILDVVALEHLVDGNIRSLQSMFHEPSSHAISVEWIRHVERRLVDLKKRAELDMKLDQRQFPDTVGRNDKGQGESAHLDQINHIQYLKDTPKRYAVYAKLEDIAVRETNNHLREMMQQLAQARASFGLLDILTAHSSVDHLQDATRNTGIFWRKLEMFSAPYDAGAPLNKAIAQAEGVPDISKERQNIARMNSQIDSMIGGLEQIIDCERAIDRHINVLESTSTTHRGSKISDGYLSYFWDVGHEGWVTERRKKGPGEERSRRDLGQRECMPLYNFERGLSGEQFVDLHPDGDGPTEQIIHFVPAAKFLNMECEKDLEFVEGILTSEFGETLEES